MLPSLPSFFFLALTSTIAANAAHLHGSSSHQHRARATSCNAKSGNWSSLIATYTSPASGYQGMPLGNGHIGVKIFGGVASETYQLNDNNFWSGDPALVQQIDNGTYSQAGFATNSTKRLNAYRQATSLLKAAYKKGISETDRIAALQQADGNATSMWTSQANGATYLPLGNLIMNVSNTTGYTNYVRALDLDGARTWVNYTVGSVNYYRDTFISFPDDVMVSRMQSSDGSAVTATFALVLPTNMASAKYTDGTSVTENKVTATQVSASVYDIVMTGRAPLYRNLGNSANDQWVKGRGITFEARARISGPGAVFSVSGSAVTVSSSVMTVQYTSRTSYVDPFTDPSGSSAPSPYNATIATVLAGYNEGFANSYSKHLADFQCYFRKLWINMSGDTIYGYTDNSPITPAAFALHYQYSRYIMISTNRDNGKDRPHGLLGMWNPDWAPPNQGDYFLNENVQKMHAGLEVQNLADAGIPLWRYLQNMAVNGAKTATNDFGFADGSWLSDHFTDIWLSTTCKGDASVTGNVISNQFAIWFSGGLWLMNNVYDKYAFDGNITFLNQNYKLIEGAAKFAMNYLIQVDGVNGELSNYLSTGLSASPENSYVINGTEHSVDLNTASDLEVYNNLFQIIQLAAANLTAAGYSSTVNATFVNSVKAAQAKLPPLTMLYRTSSNGTTTATSLKEWYNEFPSYDEHHRHGSHLLNTFPLHYTGWGKYTTPDLYNVTAFSWWMRGGPSNPFHPDGTSSGIRIGFPSGALSNHKHGVFHAYGSDYYQYSPIPAPVGEALIDSTNGEIAILPFLPHEWSSGSISGVRARGGYELDINWSNGVLTSCNIRSSLGTTPRVRYQGNIVTLSSDSRFTVTNT